MDEQMENTVVEETTQDNPMPTEIQEEPGQVPEETQQPIETETIEETNESPEPPKDNKAWAAMRVENKKLKAALEETGVDTEYLNQLREVTQPRAYNAPLPQDVTEDDDLPKVTGAINQTQREVIALRQQLAHTQNLIRENEDLAAEAQYPQLKTDAVFQQLVSEKRLASEVLGRHRRTSDICAEVSKILSRRDEQVQVQTRQETEKQILEKQRVTAEVASTTSKGRSAYNNDELRTRIRKGDEAARDQYIKDNLLEGMDF